MSNMVVCVCAYVLSNFDSTSYTGYVDMQFGPRAVLDVFCLIDLFSSNLCVGLNLT